MHNQTVDIDTIFFCWQSNHIRDRKWRQRSVTSADSAERGRFTSRWEVTPLPVESHPFSAQSSDCILSECHPLLSQVHLQTINIFFKIFNVQIVDPKMLLPCLNIRFLCILRFEPVLHIHKSVNPLIRMWYSDIHPSFLGKHAASFCYPLYPYIIPFLWNVSFYPRQIIFAF